MNISSRRKTFSAGNTSEDYASDTLKRRRKFSWVKSNFMRRKTEKKIISGSQTDLNSNRLSTISFDTNPENSRVPHPNDPLRKSVSLELLPTSVESDENLQSKMTQEGSEQFQGYLRYICMLMLCLHTNVHSTVTILSCSDGTDCPIGLILSIFFHNSRIFPSYSQKLLT